MRFRLFSLFIFFVTLVNAQTSQIATLLHDGEVKLFYGGQGFIKAYEEAADGDIITLSSGSFTTPASISKSISIRGAGMGVSINDNIIMPTTLGTLTIRDTEESQSIRMEGLNISILVLASSVDLFVEKCLVPDIKIQANVNLSVIHSEITGQFHYANGGSLSAVNSIFKTRLASFGSGIYAVNLRNCIIGTAKDNLALSFNSAQLTNCIIDFGDRGKLSQSGNSFLNCVIRSGDASIEIPASCHKVDLITPLFKDDGYYLLSEEVSQIKGNDGKEVGIYGGSLPFNPVISGPSITRLNVSPKSSIDGKISIDFEIKAGDQ